MATGSCVGSMYVSRNNQLKRVESAVINTSNRKRKGCFGCFEWIRLRKHKRVSTMQTNSIKCGMLLTADYIIQMLCITCTYYSICVHLFLITSKTSNITCVCTHVCVSVQMTSCCVNQTKRKQIVSCFSQTRQCMFYFYYYLENMFLSVDHNRSSLQNSE
jgi:hypothetical protein